MRRSFLPLVLATLAACGDAPAPAPVAPAAPAAPRPARTSAEPLAAPSTAPAADPTTRYAAEVRTGAWSVVGSVRAAGGGRPLPGARVDLALVHEDGRTEPIGAATSDAGGAFDHAFAGPLDHAAELAAGIRLVARTTLAAHQPHQVAMPLPRRVDDPAARRITIAIQLAEGAAVRGRVVDAAGPPVGRATVALSVREERSGPGGLALLAEVSTLDDGLFALGFTASTSAILTARADGVGVAWKELDLVARTDMDLGDLALGGGEPLSGFARHLDGTPARGIELWAVQGDLLHQADGFETAVRRAREVERSEGLSWSRTFTDAGGAFTFRGLRPDHYGVKPVDPAIVVEPRQARWQPGQTDVEITVYTPMLHVRVVDAGGAGVPGALVEAIDLGLASDGSYTPGGTRRALARGREGLASFSADPETPLAVRARLGARSAPERLVYFGMGTQHLEAELVLAERTRDGVLRLVVPEEDPAQLGARAALLSTATGTVDADADLVEADDADRIRGLPTGTFGLLVDFTGPAGSWYFPWRAKSPITLTAGAETTVTVDAARGARLAIAFEISGPPPAGYAETTDPRMQRERYGTRIALVPRGEGVERTLDLVVGGESGGVVLPGETADARDLLVPGDYDLRVEGARWRPLSTRIRLTAGKKLTAFVELLAR